MGSCTIEIRLKPRAKGDRIAVGDDGTVDVAVTSPPVDNRANEHLIKLLADRLDLPKSAVRLIRGEHARRKVASIEGIAAPVALARLRAQS